MPPQRIHDIDIHYEITGDGEDTVVLVHGGWTDHRNWALVVPRLAERHRVVTYDRRGHSRSLAPTGQGSRRQHEADLAALIETLELGIVNLVGNSYGGSISLGLAARRPDLVRCVIAHEPPLLGVNQLHPPVPVELANVHAIVADVVALLHTGDLEGGARLFVERIALGPDAWSTLFEEQRRTFVANASTFLEMVADPHWGSVPALDSVPVLLTDGDASPTWRIGIVKALACTANPQVARHTFPGAGHVPHLTDAGSFAGIVGSFVSAAAALHPAWSE